MVNYPQELAQYAAYQSYTSRLTELWSLPKPAQGLNTYNNKINKCMCMKYVSSHVINYQLLSSPSG